MASLLGGVRRPSRAQNKAPAYVGSGRVNIPWKQPSGMEAQMSAMGSVGTLFAIINAISTEVSKVEWHLYRKAASGKDEDRAEVTAHPAVDLWNSPNKFMSRQEFVEASQQHVELTGEGWAIVGRNPASPLPLELWPVRPDYMAPIPDIDAFISEYVYTDPNGREVHYGLDSVLRQRMPNPLDPYRGMGVVQALLTDLDATRYSAEWNRNFFRNSAEPGGIIEVEKRLEDDEFDEMSDRWDEQHKGVANAHRVAILENGAKWVNRTFSMRDMQFAELRNVSRDVIMQAFAISKTRLGISDDVNRAVALAAKAVHGENLLVPRLDRWKGVLNRQMLPLFGTTGQGLEWDYDSPVPADVEDERADRLNKAQVAEIYLRNFAKPNSVKKALALPDDLEFEDRPLQPAPGPATAPAEPGAAEPDEDQPTQRTAKQPENVTLDSIGAHLAKAFQNSLGIRNAPPLESPPDGWPEYDRETVDEVDLAPVQEAWEKALAALLGQWTAGVLLDWIRQLVDAIRLAVRRGRPGDLTTLNVDTDDAITVLADAMAAMGETAAGHAVDEAADHDVDLTPTWPDADALTDAARQVVDFEAARVALAAGREAARLAGPEADADSIADEVEKFLEEMSDAGAETALGNALTDVQNQARAATFQSGPVGALYASEQMDRNTCRPCREIHGRFVCTTDDQGPLYALYPTGGYRDCKGRWRCRGTVTGVWRPKTVRKGGR
ncbi:MAG TPA: phage portal protein [Amycolatopsis sp.]|nr:phage portal protein [Amycolatopsis sp.]